MLNQPQNGDVVWSPTMKDKVGGQANFQEWGHDGSLSLSHKTVGGAKH
jgi:hypothetical protein